MNLTIEKNIKGLKGEVEIPADKSISHRAAMFAYLSKNIVKIDNFSSGADCHSTLNVIKSLGCEVTFLEPQKLLINAKKQITVSDNLELYCGNSGTTMRLFSGILAGKKGLSFCLTGDESLSKRPMKRVISPLTQMGAEIEHNDFKAPLKITAQKLKAINYNSALASAQVKSAILLAGLDAEGVTSFSEPYKSRNHTELMLKYMDANIETKDNTVCIKKSELTPKDFVVCGDISSAAFFMVAAAIVPNSCVVLKNVGINPTRTGIIDVLKKMGAQIEILDEYQTASEQAADIKISYSELKSTVIEGEIIPRLIDELPVIALLATQAEGTTIIKNAQDLRNKEADRISAIVTEFKKIGADIEETPDGFIIQGKTKLKGDALLQCYHDHRIAMTLYVAGLICEKPITIESFEWVNISFPEFEQLMCKLF